METDGDGDGKVTKVDFMHDVLTAFSCRSFGLGVQFGDPGARSRVVFERQFQHSCLCDV